VTRRGGPDRSGLDPSVRRALDAGLAADDALIARVKARVMAAIREEPSPLLVTSRAAEGAWARVGPGLERKVLWATPAAVSAMWRLAPGASLPPHLHAADEECVVLEGSVRIGADLLLRAGDFHVAPQGSRHEATATETGAVVFLRCAPD
jgi:quercetin dioxygenase-like cupin family protein